MQSATANYILQLLDFLSVKCYYLTTSPLKRQAKNGFNINLKMPPKVNTEKKMAVLRLINENKAILYGKFSTDLEKKNKIATWVEILILAKSLELVSPERPWTYVRDQLYSGWKTTAMAKKDKMNKTGGPGGKEVLLDKCEEFIVEVIVGLDSPVVDGLNISETGRPRVHISESSQQGSYEVGIDEELNVGPSTSTSTRSESKTKKQKNRPTSTLDSDDMQPSKKQFLQCELLELELYKKKLECLKLERELNVIYSKFTENLISTESFEVNYDMDD